MQANTHITLHMAIRGGMCVCSEAAARQLIGRLQLRLARHAHHIARGHHERSPRLMLTTVHIPDRGGMCVQQGNSSAVH